MNKNTEIPSRSYGADLLRIVCMLMILTSHFFVHGKVLSALKPDDINFSICWFIEACCYVMVDCFVLITGYFQSKTTFKLKKLLLLWGQVIAISGGLYLILAAVGKVDFSPYGFIAAAFPVTSSRYWFATAYVILYIISPLLNFAIDKADRRRHLIAIAVLFGFFVVFRNFFYWNDFANLHGGYSYFSFVVLYVIGAYMRKYEIRFRHPLRWYFLLSAVTASSRILLTVMYSKLDFGSVYFKALMQYNSVTVVLASVFLFDFFVHLDIKSKIMRSFIGFFAPLTFGVYLVHEQIEVKNIIWPALNPSKYAKSPLLYAYLAVTIIVLFFTCSMVDFLRGSLSKLLHIPEFFGLIAKKLGSVGNHLISSAIGNKKA